MTPEQVTSIQLPLPLLTTLVIGSAMLWEVLRQGVHLLFGRLFSPGFVTVSDCAKCGSQKTEDDEELRKDIKVIKQVLLGLVTSGAIKISEDTLKDLVR